ncbi:MAG: MATE family efflux transporter [Panacagrimonas sp.]
MSVRISPMLLQEVAANLKLAAPILATQLAYVSMGTVDTIFAGRLGEKELAAVAVGSNVWFLFYILFLGLFLAVSPIVAQRVGAMELPRKIGGFVRSALLLGVVAGLIWTLITRMLSGFALSWLDLDGATHRMAQDYLLAVSWAGVPLCVGFVLRNTAEGHGLIKVAFIAAFCGLLVNALFDYLLMHGNFGFPELGPEGAGWASVLASVTMVVIYVALFPTDQRLRALKVFRAPWLPRFDRAQIFEVLRLGTPISAMVTAEVSLFSIGALLMARFGTGVVAAHQIAINFASLSFMVPLSIGFATTVRVGQAAGAGNHSLIARRGRVGIAISALYALLAATVMALLAPRIVALYTDLSAVSELAVRFLMLAAVFQLFDCVQASANGALRGIKDTRVPMIITVFAYWLIGMPIALGLAFRTDAGPGGIWWGFIVGLFVAAIGLCARFLSKTHPNSFWQGAA